MTGDDGTRLTITLVQYRASVQTEKRKWGGKTIIQEEKVVSECLHWWKKKKLAEEDHTSGSELRLHCNRTTGAV